MLSPSDELFAVVRCTIVRANRSRFRYALDAAAAETKERLPRVKGEVGRFLRV